jgi:polypyrimidine tract-binding protein 2
MASYPSSETSSSPNCSEVINKLSLLFIECQGVTLFGKRMDVNFSKHAQINPSPDTSDFSSSPLNRFNRNAAKNYRYCCAPTKMIHVSSLPANITKEDIVAHLSPHGNIINAKIFESNGKKQALVLFENEDQATEALVCKHATQLQNSNIRLAFSKLLSV